MSDHERIWLSAYFGRCWNHQNLWGDEATEYVRADLHASLTEELDRLREVLVDAEDFFNGGENHNCPTHQRIIAAIGDAKGGAS